MARADAKTGRDQLSWDSPPCDILGISLGSPAPFDDALYTLMLASSLSSACGGPSRLLITPSPRQDWKRRHPNKIIWVHKGSVSARGPARVNIEPAASLSPLPLLPRSSSSLRGWTRSPAWRCARPTAAGGWRAAPHQITRFPLPLPPNLQFCGLMPRSRDKGVPSAGVPLKSAQKYCDVCGWRRA